MSILNNFQFPIFFKFFKNAFMIGVTVKVLLALLSPPVIGREATNLLIAHFN